MEDIEPSMQKDRGSIYMDHYMENHYNVVLTVFGENIEQEIAIPIEIKNEYKKDFIIENECRNNESLLQNLRRSLVVMQLADRRRYQEDHSYRETKLKIVRFIP